jgi:hypothetical protein
VKTALKIAGGVVLLATLAWTGTFLTWHFRILGAIRTLETQLAPRTGPPTVDPNEAAALLTRSGCRSLPYMVRTLDSAKNPEFLSLITFTICWLSVSSGADSAATSSSKALESAMNEWMITVDEGPEGRRRKIDALRAWWREHGAEHHQWWRVWSPHCR